MDQKLQFKIADTEEELEQIYRLNYETFVEEIPQHAVHASRRLVDRFDRENTYFIGLEASGNIVAMISINDQRPFSLDQKIDNIEQYLPAHQYLCEIRLLSVAKAYRNTSVFLKLMLMLSEYAKTRTYDYALISGTVRQQKLYANLGFVPFAHPVGTAEAMYLPMYLDVRAAQQMIKHRFEQ